MKTDFIIVGQGLAGSLVAWHLLAEGKRILVVDRDEPETSSKVAAGLVTPLAGSRFPLPPDLAERLDYARLFYWQIEEANDIELFHHQRIARLFRNEEERTQWEKRLCEDRERYERYAAPLEIDSELISAPHGGFEMRESGWLDVPAFLELTRQILLERASYAIGSLRSEDVTVDQTEVKWKNVTADTIIFCQGWRGNQNRFFDWVPLRPTPGDILELQIPELASEGRIINKGGWLIPLGNGRFRAGSNYLPADASPLPDEQGRDEVLAKIQTITTASSEVLSHRRALRPTIRRSQVYMGRHPGHPRIAFFNGLGSKGTLNGPWHARRLVEHLLHGTLLPPGTDLSSLPY